MKCVHIYTFLRFKQVRDTFFAQFSGLIWRKILRGRTNAVQPMSATVPKPLILKGFHQWHSECIVTEA
jgi:hypothetical protein